MKQKNRKLKILTLNAGLLDVEIFGKHILEPAPYVPERLAALPALLIKNNADVIALQEVYEQNHRKYLIARLRKHYPHHFYSRQRRIFRLEDSLMLFSKIPLFDKRAMTFKAETIEEEIFAYKGVLAAKIKIKGLGEIIFYNLHTTAGGIRDQQDPSVERIRESEIRQVAGSVGKSRGRGIKIILGDINAGPQVSKKNYDVFRELGFLDAYHQKHPSESPARITWDPKNKLNIHGPHCRCPRQRIDHIFIKDADLKRLRIDKADIVLKNPTVRLRFGKRVTVSDHYGLSITIGSRSAIP